MVVLNFYFYLVPPFYFLKWNRYFWACKRKFDKFFMSFLKAQVRFPTNYPSIFSAVKHNSSVFFWLKHDILWSKRPHKSAIFLDFQKLGSKFLKLLMLILKRRVNFSFNFASFYIVMIHNSPVNFKLIQFLPCMKVPHKSPNFETFKCSGENLSNSSC